MRRDRQLTVAVNGGQRLLPAQDELMRSPARIIAMTGGWGSGKTRGCALKFLANCIANPWREIYGEDKPFSLIIGYTHKVLVDSAHRELMAITPPELILREKRSPDWEIELVNGHVIRLRTVRGAIEGSSACGLWLDEAHMVSLDVYLNYQARVRDPRSPRALVLISGLPEDGWIRTTFEGHEGDLDRKLIMASTFDNHYLKKFVIDQFLKSADDKTKIKYLEGRWMPKEGLVYHCFDSSLHLIPTRPPKGSTVHLSMDIGDKGVVLFIAEIPRSYIDQHGRQQSGMALQVVDELLPSQLSVREAMMQARSRGWNIDPAKSLIFVDPTSRRDELIAIRQELGEVAIIKKRRGDRAERIEYGLSCTNAAFRNAKGETRLYIFKDLGRGNPRALLNILSRYHRNPRTGRPVRDDTVDHAADALRYPCVHFFPLTVGAKVKKPERDDEGKGWGLDEQGRRI